MPDFDVNGRRERAGTNENKLNNKHHFVVVVLKMMKKQKQEFNRLFAWGYKRLTGKDCFKNYLQVILQKHAPIPIPIKDKSHTLKSGRQGQICPLPHKEGRALLCVNLHMICLCPRKS